MRKHWLPYLLFLSAITSFSQVNSVYYILQEELLHVGKSYHGYKGINLFDCKINEGMLGRRGSIISTRNATDFGIFGNGFFRLRSMDSGEVFYTRNGEFYFDENGWLVNKNGYRLDPPINVGKKPPISVSSETSRLKVVTFNGELIIYHFVLYDLPSAGIAPGVFFKLDMDVPIVKDPWVENFVLEQSNQFPEMVLISMMMEIRKERIHRADTQWAKKEYDLLKMLLDVAPKIVVPMIGLESDIEIKNAKNLIPGVYTYEEWVGIVARLALPE